MNRTTADLTAWIAVETAGDAAPVVVAFGSPRNAVVDAACLPDGEVSDTVIVARLDVTIDTAPEGVHAAEAILVAVEGLVALSGELEEEGS